MNRTTIYARNHNKEKRKLDVLGRREGYYKIDHLSKHRTQPCNPYLILRKASCLCGGSCPSCQIKPNGFKVSRPNDPAEIEADRVVEQVMRMPDITKATSEINHEIVVPRQSVRKQTIQLKHFPTSGSTPISNITTSRINTTRGSGRPLDSVSRSFFEPRFGTNLSNIYIHTGHDAAQLSPRRLG